MNASETLPPELDDQRLDALLRWLGAGQTFAFDKRVSIFEAQPAEAAAVRGAPEQEGEAHVTMAVIGRPWHIQLSTLVRARGIDVQGLLLGVGADELAIALVVLLKDQRFVAEARPDELGAFAFEAQPAGRYSLWIDLLHSRVHATDLTIPIAPS